MCFVGVAALALALAPCLGAAPEAYSSPIGDIDSHIQCRHDGNRPTGAEATEERACLAQFKDVIARNGDDLTFKLENGKTTVVKSHSKACYEIPVGPCVVYELVGYMAASRQFVLRTSGYESVSVRLVARQTGAVTKLEGYPRLSPSGKRFATVAASDAWDIKSPIAIFVTTNPPSLEWRFPQPTEYEEYSFVGWDGEDRVKLHTVTNPSIETDVTRTPQGWVLRRPNGKVSSGTTVPQTP